MKRKITIILLITLLVVASAIGLFACDKECEHEYGEWTVTKAATCTVEGEKTRTCSLCGNEEKETIEPLEHSYSWENDVNEHWEICTRTGCSETKNRSSHVFVGGEEVKCNDCGISLATILQTVVGDGTKDSVELTLALAANAGSNVFAVIKDGISTAKNGSVNLTITGAETIPSRAFETCAQLGSITLGNGVKSVGDYAFDNNRYMTSATVGNDVTEIGESAFRGCYELAEIKLGNKVATIGVGAFENTAIESITLPDSVTSIGTYIFGYCSKLKTVVLSENIETIPSNAFYATTALNSITLPGGLKTIENCGFQSTRVESIVIPDSVTSIGEEAFFGNSALKSITFGKGVTKLSGNLFFYCSSLTDITFLSPITEVDYDTFYDADANVPTLNLVTANVTLHFAEGQKSLTLADGETTYKAAESDFSGGNEFCGSTFNRIVVAPTEIDASEMTAEALQTKLNETIAAGKTNISVKFAADAGSDMFAALQAGLSSAADHSVHLTIGGVTAIPDNALCTYALKSLTLSEGVTSIGEDAFLLSHYKLESITLPVSLTTIGDSFDIDGVDKVYYNGSAEDWLKIDFKAMSSNPCVWGAALYFDGKLVEELTVPSTVTTVKQFAFIGVSSLKSVTFSQGVTTIGKYAFYYCSAIESVTIPATLTNFDEASFYCDNMKNVYYGGGVADWLKIEFKEGYNPCYSGAALYFDGTLVEEITIPGTSEKINDYVFYGVASLKKVTISQGVKIIGVHAFSRCSALESVSLPEGLTEIRSSAFLWCSALKGIELPSSLEIIGSSAFNACSSVETLTLPARLKSVGFGAFIGMGIRSLVLPDSVTSVGGQIVDSCKSLESIVFGSGITDISGGQNYFEDCTALTSITFKAPLTKVNNWTFSSCSTENVTLTLAAGQKVIAQVEGDEKKTWVAGDEAFGGGTTFCGYTFKAIIIPVLIDTSEMSAEQIETAVTAAVGKGAINLKIKFAPNAGTEQFNAVNNAINTRLIPTNVSILP